MVKYDILMVKLVRLFYDLHIYIDYWSFRVNFGFLQFENEDMGCDELQMAKPSKWKH